jgi:hypothetical protein
VVEVERLLKLPGSCLSDVGIFVGSVICAADDSSPRDYVRLLATDHRLEVISFVSLLSNCSQTFFPSGRTPWE